MSKVKPTLESAASAMGSIGGRARTDRKMNAVRANIARAREVLAERRKAAKTVPTTTETK